LRLKLELDKPILLVAKKSFYEVYGLDKQDPRFMAIMETDPGNAASLLRAHDENIGVIEAVEKFLAKRGLHCVKSAAVPGIVDGRYSLVVAVGGDGTLLDASHGVQKTQVLGINSRPGRSIGFFCLADRQSFETILDDIFEGRKQSRYLMRMDLHINGFRRSPPVLNDILFTGASPAATSRYRLRFAGTEEMQRSSGLWISTPAGSTGGIRAAGGKQMELSSSSMQFLVREPYTPAGTRYALSGGVFEQGLEIINLTPEAMVYVDGSRICHQLMYGDVIASRVSEHPLRIFL
jgi:NAD+ kinase